MTSGLWNPSCNAMECANVARIIVLSVDSEEVGNGHMHISTMDCTSSNVYGGLEMVSHSSFLTGVIKLTHKCGSSRFLREAIYAIVQKSNADLL
jgi:hypothetical protein